MKSITQSVTFKASPHEVFEALMDEKSHSAFTGAPASVSRKVGGKFSAWEGSLSGWNVALVKDSLIVQMWKASDSGWPEDHYSTAIFSLVPVKGGTRLDFVQTGVPDACLKDISAGWKTYYWTPLKKFLEKK